MKRSVLTLVISTIALAVNAQSVRFTISNPVISAYKPQPKTQNFTCSCHSNTNYTASFLKSNANAERFTKMTKLSVDTVEHKPSTITTYGDISENELNRLLNTTAAVNPDRMPIAKPANTDKGMPIVKTDRTTYNMPIAGNGTVKSYAAYKNKTGADSVAVVK